MNIPEMQRPRVSGERAMTLRRSTIASKTEVRDSLLAHAGSRGQFAAWCVALSPSKPSEIIHRKYQLNQELVALELNPPAKARPEVNLKELTAEAIAAIADLDDESRIAKMMRVGEAIAAAKAVLPHGELTKWYSNSLKRSQSWCSLYHRLYCDEAILQEALDWAERTDNKLARCYSIESLLKIVAAYKEKVVGKGAPTPRTNWTPKPVMAKPHPNAILAQLREIIADAEAEAEAARELDDAAAEEANSSIVDSIGHRLRGVVAGLQRAAALKAPS